MEVAAIGKQQPEKPEVPQAQRNMIHLSIRILVVFYLSWIIYQLIAGYRTGESSMSGLVVACFVLFFGAAAAAILLFSLYQWKKSRNTSGDDTSEGDKP